MALPRVATRDEWTASPQGAAHRGEGDDAARDALNTKRRLLPMGEGRQARTRSRAPMAPSACSTCSTAGGQLIVQHFMFDPSWDEGCPSCTAGSDEISDGLQTHLNAQRHELRSSSRGHRSRSSRSTRRNGAGGSRGTRRSAPTSTMTSTSRSTRRVAPVEFNFRDADELEATGMGWDARRFVRAARLQHVPARRRTGSSTPTRSTAAAPSRSAGRTTSSTSPPSAARRIGGA